MRTIIVITVLFISIVLCGFTAAYVVPHYYYHKVVNKNFQSKWFRLNKYSPVLLQTKKDITIDRVVLENENLWQKFHFSTVNIPLPVKNPFYFVSPELIYNKDSKQTKFGVTILNAENTKIFQVYFLPSMTFPNHLSKQKIFQLPLVENAITSKSSQEIWKDVFQKDIDSWNISFEEMVYNIYLLQFRSDLFKDTVKRFGLVENTNKAIIDLKYRDLDYNAELIMELRGESLYSYMLITRKDNREAKIIRNKYINETEYIESTPTLQDILINEFKSLSYNEQVDHEGMLYLTSALSHNIANEEVLKKIIFYLERGYKNEKQLEPFYRYAYYRYDKVFSKRHVDNLNLGSDIMLKLKIELEKNRLQQQKKLESTILKSEPLPELSIKQEYDLLIKQTEKTKGNKNLIRID